MTKTARGKPEPSKYNLKPDEGESPNDIRQTRQAPLIEAAYFAALGRPADLLKVIVCLVLPKTNGWRVTVYRRKGDWGAQISDSHMVWVDDNCQIVKANPQIIKKY